MNTEADASEIFLRKQRSFLGVNIDREASAADAVEDVLEIPYNSIVSEQGSARKRSVTQRVESAALPGGVGHIVEKGALPAMGPQSDLVDLVLRRIIVSAHVERLLVTPIRPVPCRR